MLKGEKEIDINQINRERGMASVDEEEHAVLDRLSFDYHQKLQGKPQSHEMVRSTSPPSESEPMGSWFGPRCDVFANKIEIPAGFCPGYSGVLSARVT